MIKITNFCSKFNYELDDDGGCIDCHNNHCPFESMKKDYVCLGGKLYNILTDINNKENK